MQRYFRIHVRVWAGAIVVLLVTKFVLSDAWWPIWVGLGWAFLLFLHYMVVKSANIDDGWADRRADSVTDKAYDAGHIDNIRDRYTGTEPRKDTRTSDDGRPTR